MWITHFIPIDVWKTDTQSGRFVAFTALTLLSAAACAVACVLLARRYAFGGARCLRWGVIGAPFRPGGFLLMLAREEWAARVPCPSCRRPRLVDRERCEHCGAAHARPAADGTEIFEESADNPPAVRMPLHEGLMA